MRAACAMRYAVKESGRLYPLKNIPRAPDTVFDKGTGWWVKERPALTVLRKAMKEVKGRPIIFGKHTGRKDKVVYLCFSEDGWLCVTKDRAKATRFKSLETADLAYPWALLYQGAKTIFIEAAGPAKLFDETSKIH